MLCDFHAHSNCSDGELTPTAVVQLAAQQGVTHFALTDHDTIAGVAEAQVAALAAGIVLVPGVELSATWHSHTYHVIGLQVDITNPSLQSGLAQHQAMREQRASLIADKLARLGITGALEGAHHYAQHGVVTRPHFARYLVAEGHASSLSAAFSKYLGLNKPAYVPTIWASLSEVVTWITGSGGIAVLAHPARYRLTMNKLKLLLSEFVAAGGLGLEVVTSIHTPREVATMARLACQYQLYASQGSDFHSPEGTAKLGRYAALPVECQPIWSYLW